MNALLISFDIVAGAILTAHAFVAIVYMSRSSRHCIRLIYIALGVAALAMLLSPMMDVEFRRHAHVVVIVCWALLIIFDQRKRQIISLGS